MFKPRLVMMMAAAVLVVVVMGAPDTVRAAHCPAFPKVVWWGALTHETATEDVQRRYSGDWKAAIALWQRNLTRLMAIQKKGSTAAIRYTTKVDGRPIRKSRIKLSGEKLDNYIDSVWKRLAVMYCLADVEVDKGPIPRRR